MENYHLTNADILLSRESAKEFLSSSKTDRAETIQLLFMLEEVLLNFQARFGETQEFTLQTKKLFSRTKIVVRVRDESFDPLNSQNDIDTALLRKLTAGASSSYTWTYKNGVNTVQLMPQKKKRAVSLTAATLISIVLAVVIGMLCLGLPESVRTPLLDDYISPILNTILGVIAGVAGLTVFFSLMQGIGAIGDVETLSKIGKRMLLSFVLGLFLLSLLATLVCSPFFQFTLEGSVSIQFSELLALLLNIIPTNWVSPFLDGNIQQMIVLALLIGIVLLLLGDELSSVSALVTQLNSMIQYIMSLIVALIPPMVFLSVFKIVVNDQLSLILKAYKLIPLCLGLTLIFILLYSVLIAIKFKVSIITVFKKAWPVFIIGLTTSSSSAALATNLKTSEKLFGIDKKVVSFGVPVGQTLFRPGEVIRYVVFGFVMAEMYDVEITISWILILLFISFLLSIATPPVAGGASVCLSVLFLQMGIPDGALGFAVAINVILGFLLTAVSLYCLQMELTRLAGSLDMLDTEVLRQKE